MEHGSSMRQYQYAQISDGKAIAEMAGNVDSTSKKALTH
ncbi:Hypothetical protein RY67_1515 [Bifidobacterium longum subsp. infantis]|jgi:hypothetical protein|uniref:Uncharacterized protein n=1 Tax=Bifidobacterium longum subsp. infantis TaxID=1682 RepID=A0A0M3T6F7_BIFLI|nr:Hypothetical protein RY67_1515 [Bifidobacterium longum subsp. infantis]